MRGQTQVLGSGPASIKKIIFFLLILLTCSQTFAQVKEAYPFTQADDAKRFFALTQEIRCLVCQNQSIADSSAPLANDLRGKVYTMLLEQKTDTEIKHYLTQRYGEFILLQPRFNKATWLLWLFPFLSIGFAGFFLYRVFRQPHV